VSLLRNLAMKSIISFVAYRRSGLKYPTKPTETSTTVELTDAAFDKLGLLVGKKDDRTIEIELEESSNEYKEALNLIADDIGKLPSEFVGIGVRRGTEFLVKRKRVYSSEEVNQAQALLVLPTPNLAELIEFGDGDVPIFKANSVSNHSFGALFPSWRLGVTRALGERMMAVGFNGLGLEEMACDKESPQKSPIYWIRPTIELPPSKLDLCDNLGKPLGVRSKGCHFLAKSDPVELVYDEAEFRSVEFDVAYTKEKIGSGGLVSTQLTVVSQSFRSFLEYQVEGGLEFTPVRIGNQSESHT
jgi:hypothetical protein